MLTSVMPPPLADQMVGGHLHLAPGAVGDLGDRILGVAGDEHPARGRQGLIRAVVALQLVGRPADELVDVADIVGEQEVALGVLDRGAGIMAKAREAEIDPRAVEQSERAVVVAAEVPGPVRHLVADMGELGGREPAGEVRGLHFVEAQILGAVEHVGIGYLAGGAADRDLDLIVADEIFELLGEIFAEVARPGDADRIAAGLVEPAEGAGREFRRAVRAVVDSKLGIGEQAGRPRVRVRPLAAEQIAGEGASKGGDRFVEHRAQRIDQRRYVFDFRHRRLGEWGSGYIAAA
jgi:hypothetical protein